MKEDKLQEASDAYRQFETFRKLRRDLEHYNSRFDGYAGGENKDRWWGRIRRLFVSSYIELSSDEVVVDPVEVYGTVRFSTQLGYSDEVRFEIAKSRARIIGCMIEEARGLEKMARQRFDVA